MELQIDSEDDLGSQHDREGGCEGRMYVGRKLAAAMLVPQEISNDSEDNAEGLQRNMPSRTDDLEVRQDCE